MYPPSEHVCTLSYTSAGENHLYTHIGFIIKGIHDTSSIHAEEVYSSLRFYHRKLCDIAVCFEMKYRGGTIDRHGIINQYTMRFRRLSLDGARSCMGITGIVDKCIL